MDIRKPLPIRKLASSDPFDLARFRGGMPLIDVIFNSGTSPSLDHIVTETVTIERNNTQLPVGKVVLVNNEDVAFQIVKNFDNDHIITWSSENGFVVDTLVQSRFFFLRRLKVVSDKATVAEIAQFKQDISEA